MAYAASICGILLFGCAFISIVRASEDDPIEYMSKEEREALKEEARDMFYHGYNAYMDNAYPADELMPLSCKGRYRGSEPDRGDIDTTLGNFSLTLVDAMDTLVLLGDLEEFQNAVKLVIRDVSFETDVIVSLFETNIRVLGGLLSSHILAEYMQQRADIMPWYRGELLDLAKDLGYRFLPAFNTTTGIPYGRINLKNGMKGIPLEATRETCTACAGSMILEMAALSRLTGEPIFEEKAQRAMDSLWRMRHRGTDLMGSVLNVNSGDWVRRDSGVGAGIDSYYEYCLKAYILLGDEKYLGRFNKHYQAVMKYISQGPMLLDVHMHRPNTNSKNFMDALLAFWPGLQVLKGDIKPAVETHEMLYQVMQRHNFIPEAFTTDFQVHWGHHPLRPEFLESTYFLYRATGDHYYLGVGRKVLRSLQTYARVSCGYAAVSDVRTNKNDDTMDSFVLSETFKYLFLLFAEPSELVIDPDEFVFTTEGHLLPLTLASIGSNTSSGFEKDIIDVDEFDRTCPNSLHLFPASVRQPLRNMVEDVCPRRTLKRKISASQFQANNLEHLSLLSDMGITIITRADGRVQLLHTFANANTAQDAEEGLLFMQEMIELSKMQTQQAETKPQAVTFTLPTHPKQETTLLAGPAHFGRKLRGPNSKVTGKVIYAEPPTACTELQNADKLVGKIVIVDRGDCMFVEKARRIQKAGALAGVVLDNVVGSSAATFPMFAMSGDGNEVDYVVIPIVFLFNAEATRLLEAIVASRGQLVVTIGEYIIKDEVQLKAPNDLSMFERLKGSFKEFIVRQMAPQESGQFLLKQNSATGNTATPIGKHTEIIREEDQKIIVEFQHLKAEITHTLTEEEIRITVNLDKTLSTPQEHADFSDFEKKWRFLRKMFVNQIFANTKKDSSLYIKGSVMKGYYKWVQTERGLSNDVINNMNLSRKVLWFLKELGELGPELSVADKTNEVTNINKRRLELLKQHLLSKMDDMAFLKNVAMKLKSLKSTNPEMEQLFEQLESGKVEVENYALFGKLLREIFEGEDEDMSQHIVLLDHLHKAIQINNPSEILIDQLRKEFGDSLELTNFSESEGDFLVGESRTDDTESKESKKTKSLQEYSKINVIDSRNLDDFENFILIEIEKAAENPTESSSSSLKNLDYDKSEVKSDIINRGADWDTENDKEIVDKHRDEQFDKKEARYDERKRLLQDIRREISDSQNNNNDDNNNKDNSNMRNNNEIKLNTKINLETQHIPDEQLRSNDPLEDFKKPLWASDEGKILKGFSEFQQKKEIQSTGYANPERSNYEYRGKGEEEQEEEKGRNQERKNGKAVSEEHAGSQIKINADTREGKKHIDDEL
ncbi:ER degradation-enhancing alpha-mannosidase-like protein 3 [Neodiprion virginianus]|uniref:ER degradation-enhancing alpha-mannosidase-like protein 3 n=1 Tax=Neodiprion virginianus TaxID=2961670 RepID=UPI001EE7050A|nr:ER degradation-enhancing alpha-mannosidase-like protein 3 [Neodiprion virginianus]XP_046605660.1 ER degradation-enhancing alpha-mannosidase-like protein 3 [Neodiprion virginianus]